jgi:hypothetical protein
MITNLIIHYQISKQSIKIPGPLMNTRAPEYLRFHEIS